MKILQTSRSFLTSYFVYCDICKEEEKGGRGARREWMLFRRMHIPRLARNRIFLRLRCVPNLRSVHCPSGISFYRIAPLRHQWKCARICASTLNRLASINARESLSHACLRLRGKGDNYSRSREIAIPRYKEMNAMIKGRYRHAFLAVDEHFKRILNVDDRVY